MYCEVLLQNDEVVFSCLNYITFYLCAMWNIGVLEVLSKEEEETSKLDTFNYVQ